MRVKFADLGIQDRDVLDVVEEVLRSGRFIGGQYVEQFAQDWADFCGTHYCVPVASGSAALTAAIKAAAPTPGAKIIVPALSFAATVFSVVEAGCQPVYCDVLPNGLIDQDLCGEILDRMPDVYGVVPVHLYGQLITLGKKLDRTVVIEDACQAHGALCKLQGLAACFSFYPSKNLGAAGDAGAVITNSESLAHYVRIYTNYGDPPGRKYAHLIRGTNARMDNIQAAILCYKLSNLTADNMARSSIAFRYVEAGIVSHATSQPCVWHVYPILVNNPAGLQAAFKNRQIDTSMYYNYTLPSVYDGIVYGNTKNAEFIARHAFALPVGPHMEPDQVDYVIETMLELAELDVGVNGTVVWRLK